MNIYIWAIGTLSQLFIRGSYTQIKSSKNEVVSGNPLGKITSQGRPQKTSYGRPQKTSYGRPHMGLYVTPRDVPYRRPEDALYQLP